MTYQPKQEEMQALLRMVKVQAAKVRLNARDVPQEDLVAEGNLALVKTLRRYNEKSAASAWTYCEPRVYGSMLDYVWKVRNPGISKRKKEKTPYSFEELNNDIQTDEKESPERAALLAALTVLGAEERFIIERFLDGYTILQIGDLMGLTRGQIRTHWERLLPKLHTFLGSRTDIS